MKVTVTLSGQDKLARSLERLQGRIGGAARRALQESVEELREEARAALERGSAMEGSEAVADSLFVEIADDGLSARVGTELAAGRDLEFGTRTMPAQPWLLPTFERLKPRIAKRLAGAVRSALAVSGRRYGRTNRQG